jgi:O-methyltransferase
MLFSIRHMVQSVVRKFGVEIIRYRPLADRAVPADVSPEDRLILGRIGEFTMTTIERQLALISAVRYVARAGIKGSIVECGVWRGGSSMATALTLMQAGEATRPLYLFDTFEGMTAPTERDRDVDGVLAADTLKRSPKSANIWCYADLDDVTANMRSTGYPMDQVHLIKGPVEQTIPREGPEGPIAILRLDTDWYESTRHELQHLFPLLQTGGVLIVDDYGAWQGARQAVDEYFESMPPQYFHRIDYTGRMLIKGA